MNKREISRPIKDFNNNMSNKDNIKVIKIVKISPNFSDSIKYRAEGNANIVVEFMNFQVIRFKKTSCRKEGSAISSY